MRTAPHALSPVSRISKQRNIVRNWTTLARLINEQEFPAGVRLGAQTRAWEEAEVEAWLESRRITPLARDASLLVTRRDPVPELVQTPARAARPAIGRQAVQEAGHVAAKRDQVPVRSTPPPRSRSLAMSDALEEAPEDNPRR